MDRPLDLPAVRRIITAPRLRVISTVDFLHFPRRGILDHLPAFDEVGITEPNFLTGSQAEIFRRRNSAKSGPRVARLRGDPGKRNGNLQEPLIPYYAEGVKDRGAGELVNTVKGIRESDLAGKKIILCWCDWGCRR